MERLRATQLDLLARHRARALDMLLPASAAYDGRSRLRETPEGKALLAQPPELLVSVAISAAAAAVERRRLQSVEADAREVVRFEAADAFPSEILAALQRRRLPFTRADVELILDLGTATMDHERPFARSFETVSFGVAAAAALLRTEVASASLLASLERAGQAIEALGPGPASGPADLRRRIRALTSAQLPGGLLDLLVVDPHDAWADQAKEILRNHAERWDGIQEVVVLLARARGVRPTTTWQRSAARLALQYEGLGDLLRSLLEPVLAIDLSSSGLPRPPAWLLAPDNEVLVKGAAWATAEIDEPWVVPLLGRLALRGAAPSPHATVTTALSLPVASAAVEALAAIGTPAARRELGTLLSEIRRRDLLKRIAAIVGEPGQETRARDERIRREKRRAVTRRADPEPQERQRLASAAVRRDLAPMLREAGFTTVVGRSFWRELPDRVETVHCKAHRGGMTLELGIWFGFVPRRSPVVEREGRPTPAAHAGDLQGNVHAWDDDLRAAGAAAEKWFARWRPLPAVLRWLLVGSPSDETFGPGMRGASGHALLTGYVARELGESAVARRHLEQAAAAYRALVEERRARGAGDVPSDLDAWVARLEADAAR
jgi:hypothetical protein